jgi:hypothetical protein
MVIDAHMVETARNGLGVDWYFQDVNVPQPLYSPSSPVFLDRGSVIGLGLTYFHRVGPKSNWFEHLEAGYGIGSSKDVVNGTPTITDQLSITSWNVQGGLGYTVPVTDNACLYGKGGLFYSSTTGKFETQVITSQTLTKTGEPWNVAGLEKSFGGAVKLGPKYSLFGESYSQFGWGSVTDGKSEHHETVKYGCYRGGLMRWL